MKVTYLGQAGLLIQTQNLQIIVDPYLSNSVEAVNPSHFRRVPVDEQFFHITPDIMIFTHDHLDHFDPNTAERFLKTDSRITVLSPNSVWQKVRKYGGPHNYVQLDRHSRWTQNGVRFTAVKAAHSDPHAIGFLLESENQTYYITGDTLYNTDIFHDLPSKIDAVFLPINGVGNNMNSQDAADFAKDCGAQVAVPLHVGMFDEIDPESWKFENKIIPTIYKEIKL